MISHHRTTSHYRLIAPLRQGGFERARSRHHRWPSYIEVVPGFQHVGHREDLVNRLSVVAGQIATIHVDFGPGKPVINQSNTFHHALVGGRAEVARLHDAFVAEIDAMGGCTYVDAMMIGDGYRPALIATGQKGRREATLTGLLLTDTDAKREHVIAYMQFACTDLSDNHQVSALKYDGAEECHATS